MPEKNKYAFNGNKQMSVMDIVNIIGQTKNIMQTNNIEESYEGVKKAMEMSGMTMAQLKELRQKVNLYADNFIAKSLLKKQNINLDDFLGMVDDFIAKNDDSFLIGQQQMGNRQMRRLNDKLERKHNNSSGWRSR